MRPGALGVEHIQLKDFYKHPTASNVKQRITELLIEIWLRIHWSWSHVWNWTWKWWAFISRFQNVHWPHLAAINQLYGFYHQCWQEPLLQVSVTGKLHMKSHVRSTNKSHPDTKDSVNTLPTDSKSETTQTHFTFKVHKRISLHKRKILYKLLPSTKEPCPINLTLSANYLLKWSSFH